MKLWIMIRLVGKILAINFLFLYLKVFLPSLLSLLEQIFWWLLCALIKMNMRTLAFQDLWLNNETSFFSNDSIPLHMYAWLCNLISNFSQIKKIVAKVLDVQGTHLKAFSHDDHHIEYLVWNAFFITQLP